jgi:hypothetical protein
MSQSKTSRSKAVKALRKCNNDIVNAIMVRAFLFCFIHLLFYFRNWLNEKTIHGDKTYDQTRRLTFATVSFHLLSKHHLFLLRIKKEWHK